MNNKKGFSLLELLLVMGIIAALIIAAFIVYPKVQSYRNVKIESNNIGALKAEVTTLYNSVAASIPEDANLNDVLIKSKVVPENMIDGSNNLKNVWGGDVYVGTYNIARAVSFTIQYNHVPRDECAKLVMQASTGFEQVVVGPELTGDTGGIIKDGTGRDVVFGLGRGKSDSEVPLDVPTVVEACNRGENAFVLFKFF